MNSDKTKKCKECKELKNVILCFERNKNNSNKRDPLCIICREKKREKLGLIKKKCYSCNKIKSITDFHNIIKNITVEHDICNSCLKLKDATVPLQKFESSLECECDCDNRKQVTEVKTLLNNLSFPMILGPGLKSYLTQYD
jgi:hypothetical protein